VVGGDHSFRVAAGGLSAEAIHRELLAVTLEWLETFGG
jgi:hypothetical protein